MSGKGQAWSGRTVTDARAYWRPRLPLPCRRCGRPVVHDPTRRYGGWHVGHIIDRALGGSVTDRSNQWVEHDRCNMRAGGQLGAAITNARHQQPRIDSERARGIRGI